MNELETAVIKTLAYADLFDQALTQTELYSHLIALPLSSSKELPKKHTLFDASHSKNIYHLTGRHNLARHKAHQLQTKNQKLKTAKKSIWIFKLVPWIKLVAITGSIAGGTPKPDDDIDLLIITDTHRLWLSRLMLTILLNVTGKRRKPTDNPNKVNNKFCLNMWLSMQNLEETSHDIYTANELANIIPLLNRQGAYEYYIQSNTWIKEFLPNFYSQLSISSTQDDVNTDAKFSPLAMLDKLAEKIQRRIMRRPTNETVQDARLAFHPHDYKSEILAKYKRKLVELGIED